MMVSVEALKAVAYRLRKTSIEITTRAGSGHPTSALSAADIIAALFLTTLHYDIHDPHNPDNDRFILSKGHAVPVLYALYYELGIISEEELHTYRQLGSRLEGHPTPRFPYVAAATGSLGQGLSIALGIALNRRYEQREYYTYVLMGDSEIAEGAIWEAAAVAAYYRLDNLIGIVDVNGLGQSVEVMGNSDSSYYARKFEAFGWYTLVVDGQNMQALVEVLHEARTIKGQPVMIIAHTIKGAGVALAADQQGWHGKVLSPMDLPQALEQLAQSAGRSAQNQRQQWKLPVPTKCAPLRSGKSSTEQLPHYKAEERVAPRKAFGHALAVYTAQDSRIMVLDAEVQNSTYTELVRKKVPHQFIECFVAEQNMVGMAVGLSTCGKIPVAATFGAFFTRAYDQIRMAAISRAALRLVGTHVGCSIGADGPSQMALEDIALMRALPHSLVLYPADAVATVQLLTMVLAYEEGISYMRTTRQEVPVIYGKNDHFTIGQLQVVRSSVQDSCIIVAAGITLHEALKAYDALKEHDILVTVIDLYCIKPFPTKSLRELVIRTPKVLVVEDHYPHGGIGDAVAQALQGLSYESKHLCVYDIPNSGSSSEQLRAAGIDKESIKRAVQFLHAVKNI
jgi:transketolase